MPEKVEARAAVHLPHDPFGAGVDAFGSAVVVRKGEAASTAARSSSGPSVKAWG